MWNTYICAGLNSMIILFSLAHMYVFHTVSIELMHGTIVNKSAHRYRIAQNFDGGKV